MSISNTTQFVKGFDTDFVF